MVTKKVDIDDREHEVSVREQNVKTQEKLLERREKELIQDQDEVRRLKEKVNNEKLNEILDQKKQLEKVKDEISQKNIDLQKINSSIAEATATKTQKVSEEYNKKIAELEKLYKSQIDKYLKETEEAFLNRNDDLSKSLKWHNDELTKTFKRLLEEYESMLQSKQTIVDDRIAELNKSTADLDKKMAEYSKIQEKEIELSQREKKVNLKEKNYDNIIEKEVNNKYNDLVENNRLLSNQIDDLQNKCKDYADKYREISDQLMTNENLELTNLKSENVTLRRVNEDFVKKYGKFNDQLFIDIKNKADQYDSMQKRLEEINAKNIELQKQVDNYKFEQNNLVGLTYQKQYLEQQLVIERTHFKVIKDEFDALKNELGDSRDGILASKAIETVVPEFKNQDQNERLDIDEIEWLNNIIENCEKAGYKFSKRLFYSFHTCLKTADMSPLTVLAGVSGTGKSKLPQLYSKFGGIYFMSLAVQPDWDSPQSLFGYYNSIEKRFNATSLLRALVCFQKNKSDSPTKDNIVDLSDNLLIVLLDEMNLAHVELYFSDLLSKLELKRDEHEKVSFEVDLGASNEKYKVYLTDNIKWVGTMNEDETTKSLSDKVIDRGNVISFPRPTKFERYTKDSKSESKPKINKKNWENWINNKYQLNDDEANKYMNIVTDINNQLIKVNRALGHRVWQSIENYMISHPLVITFKDDDEKRAKALDYAFVEALVQKVMTKLRGIECDGEQGDALLGIRKILESCNYTTLIEDFDSAMQSVTGTFVWDSAKYLNEEYKFN